MTSTERRLFAGVLVVAFVTTLGVSYLDEDAFISFRVVDNAVHGHGLRWNVDERVQVYTNPLWVLALVPLHAVLGDIAWSSWTLSAVCSTAAVAVVARRLVGAPSALALAFGLPLLLSSAFVDYTSSGLENPLVYLFVALFVERATREPEGPAPWFSLASYAALAAVTRLDSLLLFGPALAWLWARDVRGAAYGRIAAGFAPLGAWLLFALFYYGTVFPNPKYAKLNGGVERLVYVKMGLVYLLDIARNDVITFLGLTAAAALALAGAASARGRAAVPPVYVALLGGAVVYAAYVVAVGGDFMAGRYWATPFFLAVTTLALWVAQRVLDRDALAGLAAVLVFARMGVQPIVEEKDTIETREQKRTAIVRAGGIRDQRYNCSFYESLLAPRGPITRHAWAAEGLRQRKEAEAALAADPQRRHVIVEGNVGKTAYFGGPSVTYVDRLGIADALIARLPDADGEVELVGHLEREVPEGYVEARATDVLDGLDPRLRRFYEAQRLVIAGPLFDAERLSAIWRLNAGAYDADLADYARAR